MDCDFFLNGAPYSVASGCTLAQLVATLGLEGQALALAVNRTVVPRQRWPEHAIAAGERIELVRAIGGG
jgi:sulfur carrier protein